MQVSSNAANSAISYPIAVNQCFSNNGPKDREALAGTGQPCALPKVDVEKVASTNCRTKQGTAAAQVREDENKSPRSACETCREKFCHTMATMSGWLAGGVYGLSFVWIPMLFVGAIAGTLNKALDRVFNLQQDKPYKDGLWTTVCAVPALIGGTIALTVWVATSPITLAIEAYEQHKGVANSPGRGVVGSLGHAVAQGKSSGEISWAKVLGVKI